MVIKVIRLAKNWQDIEIISCSDGEKLERWKDVRLVRPDPQIIWKTPKGKQWSAADAYYRRSATGGGEWDKRTLKKDEWKVDYKDLKFIIRPTNFKHTGLFPEQAVNWDLCESIIKAANRPAKVLNLFAYTGGATLACAKAGASVVHVDASKGMITWARENANASGLSDAPIRWIIDDCKKFIEREIRRGNKYDGIILDPPSYGRGPGGEVWKLEDSIFELMQLVSELLADDALFLLLNSYTTGLGSSVMKEVLAKTVNIDGSFFSSEIGLPVTEGGCLPCGSTAIWLGKSVSVEVNGCQL